MEYNFDDIRNSHLAENFALTYGGINEIEKARKAEPIGTIKQMGGREVIKTASGWRAHTKGSASKTQEHLKLNPSANIPDHKLKDHALNTPEKDLNRVKKESTDPKLRQHAHEELQRRKDSEQKIQYSSVHGDLKYSDVDTARSAHEKSGKDKNGTGNSIVQHGNDFIVTTHDRAKRYMKEHDAKDVTFDKKKSKKDIEHGKKREHQALKEKMDAHEKRGFDEKKGDEDVTGKGEKIPKEKTNEEKLAEKGLKYLKVKNGNKDVDVNSVFKQKFSQTLRDKWKKLEENFYAKKGYKAFGGGFMKTGTKEEEVNINDIIPGQNGLDESAFLNPKKDHKSSTEKPEAVKIRDPKTGDHKIVLIDGHHRVAQDILDGKTKIKLNLKTDNFIP